MGTPLLNSFTVVICERTSRNCSLRSRGVDHRGAEPGLLAAVDAEVVSRGGRGAVRDSDRGDAVEPIRSYGEREFLCCGTKNQLLNRKRFTSCWARYHSVEVNGFSRETTVSKSSRLCDCSPCRKARTALLKQISMRWRRASLSVVAFDTAASNELVRQPSIRTAKSSNSPRNQRTKAPGQFRRPKRFCFLTLFNHWFALSISDVRSRRAP